MSSLFFPSSFASGLQIEEGFSKCMGRIAANLPLPSLQAAATRVLNDSI